MNRGPLDLQSNALPLSYTPLLIIIGVTGLYNLFIMTHVNHSFFRSLKSSMIAFFLHSIKQMDKVLNEELKLLKRMKEKLLTKNGVLLSQRIKISNQIRKIVANAEVNNSFVLL